MFKLSSCWSNWHSYSTKRPLTKWSALRVKSWHHLSTTHWICIQPHPFQMVLKSRRRIRMPIPTFSSGLRKNGQHIGIARNPSQQTQQLMEGYMLYLSLRMGMETPWVPHSAIHQTAWQIWETFKSCREATQQWGRANSKIVNMYRLKMCTTHPELQLCSNQKH